LDDQPKTDVHMTSVLGLRLDDQPKTDVHETSVLGLVWVTNQVYVSTYLAPITSFTWPHQRLLQL